MPNFSRILFLFNLLFIGMVVNAQTRYNISNSTVNECEGILVDSENGKEAAFPTGYAHNEDFCFTICVPNSPSITVVFSEFLLETPTPPTAPPCQNCDWVEIFDGPDCNSNLIGKWVSTNSPRTVSSTGNCISIRFRSDGNKSGEGFELSWNATPPPPLAPVIQPIANVNCNSNTVVINFDKPIPCSQLVPGNFTFSGPSGSTVTSVTPINCVNGFASSATLGFNQPLDQSGSYSIIFDFNFIDICFKTYRFQIAQSFNIINCPLIVDIVGDTTVCLGYCVTLTAVVTGGNPANYQYTWTPAAPNAAVISVCPIVDQSYTLTVTDGSSQPASASHFVRVLPLPNAGNDTAMCRFGPAVNFTGTPAGGFWQGPGITNGNNGTFQPANAGPGTHDVYYFGPNGCPDLKRVTVYPVSAGARQAVCLNSPPFQLNGTPVGGTWTGTNTTPAGIFNPIQVGTFQVSYTEPTRGCVAIQTVEVVNAITIPDTATITACDKQGPFLISSKGTVAPIAGRWTGTGITNQGNGTFDPAVAGVGLHKLAYTINGCSDTTDVLVSTIDAGPDVLICPSTASQLITVGNPLKGFWTGPGIVDNGDTTFNFDPSLITMDSIFVNTYTKDGCADTRVIFLLTTTVTDDTLQFCPYSSPTTLTRAFTQPNIQNGIWSGPGLVTGDSIVNPGSLPTGISYAYYEVAANGCIDSLAMLVNPKPSAGNDTTLCPQAANFFLKPIPTGGTWSGAGIVDPNTGEFSPAQAGFGADGVFEVYYSAGGCEDTAVVTLKSIDAKFNGLQDYYCLNNTTTTLIANPTGGTFSGPGISGNSFNPMSAGSGMHEIVYTFGTGTCIVYDTQSVQVLDPIAFNFVYPTATLCYGDSVLVKTVITGGDSTKKFIFTWNPNKSNTAQIYIKPTTFTTFSLTVDDGCSVPIAKSASIDVFPEINYTLQLGPIVCFGDTNWGKIQITTPPLADFAYFWNTSPPSTADSVNVVAGKYKVNVTNTVTNCKIQVPITIPYYPYINADFIQTPGEPCISIVDPRFNFINLSTGADTGYWDFGDGTTIPYVSTNNPGHTYLDTGKYHVKLYVRNMAGCQDSLETDVCIFPVQQYDMPNAFTPNGDGDNDFFPMGSYVNGKFLPTGYGITDYDLKVFDRWGHLLYESDSKKTPWNGRFRNVGEIQKNGVYVYTMNVYFGPRDIKQLIGSLTLLR